MTLKRPLSGVERARLREANSKAQNHYGVGGVAKKRALPRPITLRNFEKPEPKTGERN